MLQKISHLRHEDRLPDALWQAVMQRVRSEFEEMPCLRVTPQQARALFGLAEVPCEGILRRLLDEGFLSQTEEGAYVRRTAAP